MLTPDDIQKKMFSLGRKLENTDVGIFVKEVQINYQLIYDLLYRIQGDYEYADLIDENVKRPSDIPANNTIGKEIYECGSAMTPNGYVFCVVTEEGFVKSVLLPDEVIASIKE